MIDDGDKERRPYEFVAKKFCSKSQTSWKLRVCWLTTRSTHEWIYVREIQLSTYDPVFKMLRFIRVGSGSFTDLVRQRLESSGGGPRRARVLSAHPSSRHTRHYAIGRGQDWHTARPLSLLDPVVAFDSN